MLSGVAHIGDIDLVLFRGESECKLTVEIGGHTDGGAGDLDCGTDKGFPFLIRDNSGDRVGVGLSPHGHGCHTD